MADTEPQPVVITEASAHASRVRLGVCTSLLAIGLALYFVRMWLRIRPVWKVGVEDYCITIGVALAVTDFGLLMPRISLEETIFPAEYALNAKKYSFLAIPIWGIAMMFIKSSIALLLLKIQSTNTWWRIFCWFMIAIQVAYGVGNTIFILLQCRPLAGAWDPSVVARGGQCLAPSAMIIASNVGSVVAISTDILFSLAPLAFLWKLRRPLREKILIGVLMGLGAVASVSSIIKALLMKDHDSKVADPWARLIDIGTWTILEQLLGIIVASAPYMKPLLQRTLNALGVSVTESGTAMDYGVGYAGGSRRPTFATPRTGEWTQVSKARDGVAYSDEIPLGTRGAPGGFTQNLKPRHEVCPIQSSSSSNW